MTIPNPIPEHNTDAYKYSPAGAGQPLHKEEYGQSYVLDSTVPGGVAIDTTSLHPGKYLLGLTLNRIYLLLSKMIESMQNVAVAQAQRLEILADWQNAYNSKKNTVHAFIQGNGDVGNIDDNNSESNTLRSDLNNLNSNYMEQMKANSSIVSDDAKAMQTVINQTQDNVKKASDMATSLIQQFSTIMSSIFR
ncbi:MAG: hypothetical protein H0U49_01420 [Parachlamydiaceae bacterium]|nr:hypothetical protein [Parachlamydiaceae bacterium]